MLTFLHDNDDNDAGQRQCQGNTLGFLRKPAELKIWTVKQRTV